MRTWNLDEPLCTCTWADGEVAVRLGAEVADEPYRAHTPKREFVPLTVLSGTRTRLVGHPYVFDSTGKVRRVGEAAAYFYHEDEVLLLWRCRLLEPYRAYDPLTDANLRSVWRGLEELLAHRFPRTRATITPSWNLPYPGERWREFLAGQDFSRPSPAGLPWMALIRP